MKNGFCALALMIFLSACSVPTRGPAFPETQYAQQPAPADKARIIFLRRSEDGDFGARWARLSVDGAAAGKLAREGFVVYDAAPGEHRLSIEGETRQLDSTFQAGQVYYVHVYRTQKDAASVQATGVFALIGDLVAPMMGAAPFELEAVDSSVALPMLVRLRLLE